MYQYKLHVNQFLPSHTHNYSTHLIEQLLYTSLLSPLSHPQLIQMSHHLQSFTEHSTVYKTQGGLETEDDDPWNLVNLSKYTMYTKPKIYL